jgi:hypothetical protein
MWSVPDAAARIENLAIGSDLGASVDYTEKLKRDMFEIGRIPATLLSQSDKNVSGVAMALQYFPLQQYRNVKSLMYGQGIQVLNRLMLKMIAFADSEFRRKFLALPKESRYRTDVVFLDPTPRDETVELDRAERRLKLGLSSRRMEMERMGYSQGEIARTQKEVEQDRLTEFELEYSMGQSLGPERSGNPNPQRPDVVTQGEAVSRTAESDLDLE